MNDRDLFLRTISTWTVDEFVTVDVAVAKGRASEPLAFVRVRISPRNDRTHELVTRCGCHLRALIDALTRAADRAEAFEHEYGS